MKTEIEKQNFIDKIVKKLSAYEKERGIYAPTD